MDDALEPRLDPYTQYIAQSGQVHIVSEYHEDLCECSTTRCPRISSRPDTSILDESYISLATKQACGMGNVSKDQSVSNPSMIRKRELGSNFTAAQRCKISNNYVPNMMQKVTRYNSRAFCGSYSADGKLFLTASQDRFLRLYRTHNGEFTEFKTILAGDVGWCLDTAFSPDGNYIVYSKWSDNNLCVCPIYGDANTQETLPLSPLEYRLCIFSLAFSSDGRKVLAGGNYGFLYMYDRECQQRVLRLDGHVEDINAVAFADNTSRIVYSAGDDGLCKVWDRRTWGENDSKPVGIFAGHVGGITYIDPRGDGRYLLTNSKDQTIKLWDVRAFSDDNGIMNAREAMAKRIWDYRWQGLLKSLYMSTNVVDDTSIMTYRGHSVLRTLIRCHFSPSSTTGQRYIYTGCAFGRVVIYDVLTGDIVKSLHGHKSCVRDVSWHPNCQEIISTSWDGVIGRWRYAGKEVSDSEEDSNT